MKEKTMKKVLFLTLVLVMVMSTTLAYGHSVDGTDPGTGKLAASHDVVVQATVNPKLVLTIADNEGVNVSQYTFNVDPGVPYNMSVDVTALSNVMSTLSCTSTGDMDLSGTVTTLPYFQHAWDGAAPESARGSRTHQDDYTITAGWDVPAGVQYVQTVTYTLVED